MKVNRYQKKEDYPLEEISYFVDWFNHLNHEKMKEEGWCIVLTDIEPDSEISFLGDVYQIQRNDEDMILSDDEQADVFARKAGLILTDSYGVVIGYKGENFLEKPETLEIYKNIKRYNF